MAKFLNFHNLVHDFSWYKKLGILSEQTEKILHKLLKSKQRILLLGNGSHHCGATSMMVTCQEYLRCQYEISPLVIPSTYTKSSKQFFKSKLWKETQNLMRFDHKTLWVYSHTEKPEKFETHLEELSAYFDVIVDLRNVDGVRETHRILVKSKKGYTAAFSIEEKTLSTKEFKATA